MSNLLEMPKQYTDAQARRWARKADYRCCKARGKQHINNRGGYQLVDYCNNVVAGVDFDLSTNDVVEFCRVELGLPEPNPVGTAYVSQDEWAEMIRGVASKL
jgi:hypothetical protein